MIITETINDLKVQPPVMLCDKDLGDIPEPLPCRSFFMIVSGSAGSGKTSFLVSLLSNKKPNIYRKVFENVFIMAPTNSLASIKSNIFRNHPPEKVYNEMTPETLGNVREIVSKEAEEDFRSLLIIDDMTVYLKDKQNEQILKDLIFNRRHRKLSIMLLVQSYTQIPLSIRKTVSHAVIFRPRNKKEWESFFEELLFNDKKTIQAIMEYVFKGKHDFLFADVNTGDLFHNFNKLHIQE
jgi:DNA replication protein DnaC